MTSVVDTLLLQDTMLTVQMVMAMDRGAAVRAVVSFVVSAVLTALTATYMIHIRVPSALRVRPRLADVGLVTGLFSGRGVEWLWYHHETAMIGGSFVLLATMLFVMLTVEQ